MLIFVIVAAEVGFWLLLAAGLTARYALGRRRLGAILLASVPLVDLVLLMATVIDLSRGARRRASRTASPRRTSASPSRSATA